MDQDVKTRWIEALRSGKYAQGKRFLRDHQDQYCCLGVLCDIVDPEGWRQDGENSPWSHMFRGEVGFYITPLALDASVSLDDKLVSLLVGMNDRGESFTDIAQVIQERA